MANMANIEDKLKILPALPGCYLMKNKDGDIIYVGKAKKLKNRVRQYFVQNDFSPEIKFPGHLFRLSVTDQQRRLHIFQNQFNPEPGHLLIKKMRNIHLTT